jgi:hypothetical protein
MEYFCHVRERGQIEVYGERHKGVERSEEYDETFAAESEHGLFEIDFRHGGDLFYFFL